MKFEENRRDLSIMSIKDLMYGASANQKYLLLALAEDRLFNPQVARIFTDIGDILAQRWQLIS